MRNIAQLMDIGYVDEEKFGVEIEVEGATPLVVGKWERVADGSLRNGCEFVFESPLDMKEAKKQIQLLSNAFNQGFFAPEFSFRTSVHVHTNVSDLTQEEFKRFLYTLLLFEPAFLQFSGEERKHNRFCLSTIEAEGLLMDIVCLFQAKKELAFRQILNSMSEDTHKYSAINLACVKRFGTIEIRTMRGTCDPVLLGTYLEVISAIRKWSIKQESVASIYEKVMGIDASSFASEVLGINYLFLKYPQLEADLQMQASLTIELPFA